MKPFKELNLLQKIGIILLMLGLGILGTILTRTPKQLPEPIGTVHDYIIDRAQGYCNEYGTSLHYIIPTVKRTNEYLGKGKELRYCDDIYYVRCQDDSLIIMTSRMFCGGVSQVQIDESFQEKGSRIIKIQTHG